MHIAIAGNIGSGKTTLTQLLSKHFGWQPHYEEVDNNPYLSSFYDDMLRWSFNLQIYFLTSRFKQIIDIRNSGADVVQDRTIYEDSYIFASNLYEMGLMSTRDYENYQSLFELMSSYMQAPDLLIYLRADIPTLVRQIAKRNRAYEQSIRLDYLKALNDKYENWIASYDKGKVLIIDSDNLEFENPEDLSKVIDSINASLNGLF
ncbi:MAG: deoxynucleoside kinase [Bacteroidales bacterium]|nr:deoxynucleoside kinase [Bacteroidales bacterium]MBR5780538.1 deoxynucleoside kinase [Bacteroidales bacterium]